jgi:hypothetical protein
VLLNGASEWVGAFPNIRAAHAFAHDPTTLASHPHPLVIAHVPTLRFWMIDGSGCVELGLGQAGAGWRCPFAAETATVVRQIERGRHDR